MPVATVIWLFHGSNQTKRAQELASSNELVTLVPLSRKGPNALDFQLTFYLGYVAAKHPTAQLVVVANDKGYDPMIAHAKILGFAAKRIGHKTRPPKEKISAEAKQVQLSVKKSQLVAPTKIIVPILSAAKSLVSKKIAKSAKPKVAEAGKAEVKKVRAVKKLVQPKASVGSELQMVSKIKKAFEKMGPKRPIKLKSFLSHLKSMLGKAATAELLNKTVTTLQVKKIVRLENNSVIYLKS